MNDDSNSTLGLHSTLDNGAFIVKIPTLTAIISPFSWQYRNGEGSVRGGYPHFMGGEPEAKGLNGLSPLEYLTERGSTELFKV